MNMKRTQLGMAALIVLVLCSLGLSQVSNHKSKKHPTKTRKGEYSHTLVLPNDIRWGPVPPAINPGAELAVLYGDPSKPGPFTLRLKAPDGYKIMPHWHSVDENVTVLQGTFLKGTGDKFDEASFHVMATGSFIKIPKGTRHFAMARGETIVQVHGIGPFDIIYVNPNDDPRKHGK